MNVVVLFSGGKDSCLALWYVLHQGWNVTSLVSIQPNNPYSYMFHYPNIQWTKLQAEALGISIVTSESGGKKEEELSDLHRCLSDLKKTMKIDGVVSGAIASEYQKTRIDKICQGLDLASFSPLWRKDPEFIIRQEVDLGFEILISATMARGFTTEWLGRKIDAKCLDDLKEISRKYGIHMAFEGGEAETFVTDGPIFKSKILINNSENIWKGDSGYMQIKSAELQMKQ
jgi:diphthine-ammonia ligase